ncbi:MAG: TrkA family potassium uptake protein [Armatimonadota bacterium]
MSSDRLEKPKKSFLVIGMGYFGEAVATKLYELGQKVVGVDNNPVIVQHLADRLTQAIEMDATDEDALATLGVRNFDVCIVGRGSSLEDSVTITMNLKELGANYIIAKAMRSKHAKILEQLQTDMIVFPEIDMAHQLVENLVHPKVVGEVQLGNGYEIEAVRPTRRLIGQTVARLQALLPVGVKFIGLHRQEDLLMSPDSTVIITETDLILVWGRHARLTELER